MRIIEILRQSDLIYPKDKQSQDEVYSESASKTNVSYDVFTGNEISVTGFLSMGKDDVKKSGTIKPAFFTFAHS